MPPERPHPNRPAQTPSPDPTRQDPTRQDPTRRNPRRPDPSPAERVLGEITATRGQATQAAERAAEILAILTNAEASDPVLMIEALLKGLAEQAAALRRIEARLDRIEARLPAR